MGAATRTFKRARSWLRRLLTLLEEPFIYIVRMRTMRQSAMGSIDTSRRWRRRRSTVTILEILSYLGAIVLLVVVVWSFVVMLLGPGILTGINNRCDRYSAACGADVGFLIPLLSVALASAIFLFYRLRHVTSPVVGKARTNPQDLVETATPDIGEIVGRDELCRVIMEDIHHSNTRRPHLLVGGVGTGKTAVLVQLTKLLAARHAVPVPIRLRDAKNELNFRKMAHVRFLAMAESSMLSEDEAEKVWRQLSKDDKIVVIADGLEEALTEGDASVHEDRDNVIRLAIHRARELRLPLIIASRPHAPLRGADATVIELEPLSEEAALEYIDPGQNNIDARWLDWIVETAGLTELPLYLQITRQLSRRGRLDYLSADRSVPVDMRSMDRSKLRQHLLTIWMEALFDGHLKDTVALKYREREAAVEWLSALACIGLLGDTIDVKYEDYYEGKPDPNQLEVSQPPKYQKIHDEIQGFLDKNLPHRHLDIRLAVTWGDRLNLVEAHGDGLRFPHSIMQAYLASRFMSTALQDSRFREDAVGRLQSPGREFLIALVLYARSVDADRKGRTTSEQETASAEHPVAAVASSQAAGSPVAAATTTLPGPARASARKQTPSVKPSTRATRSTSRPELGSDVESIRDVLLDCGTGAKDDVKKLDLYAATLEIDSFLGKSRHEEIAGRVAGDWENLRGGDQRTLDEAKLGLVFRFGDAVRTVADRRNRALCELYPAYRELLEMGRRELSYPIRLAIAQEIGAGGDSAFRVLRQPSYNAQGNTWTNAAWPNGDTNKKTGGKLSKNEHNQIPRKSRHNSKSENADKNRTLRGRTLCAWLTPLLVGSVNKYGEAARQELGIWLDHVGRVQEGDVNYFHLSLEVALAQGFKYAANRRFRHPHALPETRDYLAEQAMEMLKRARFWFTQLTLIHALCLWEMPDPGMSRQAATDRRSNGNHAAEGGAHGHGSDPAATVGYWLEAARNGKHPFVAEAGKLAVEALKTGHPERFLWIDESGIVSSVGSRAAQATKDRKHHLWIPPSAGWAALDPRAQQLVADVLLLLNLAERGEGPDEIEQRLRRVEGSDLPPCFTRDRDPLDPKTTVGGLSRAPGSNCKDGCRHRLCPYPPDGVQPYRSELSEAFCRGQQTLLNRGLSAPWQTILRADLKRFWEQMADRARGVSTDHERD
jgi:hypothetical protein